MNIGDIEEKGRTNTVVTLGVQYWNNKHEVPQM